MKHGFKARPGNKASVFRSVVTFLHRPKEARQVGLNVKKLLIVFFDIQDLENYEFVLDGQTENQHYYKQALLRLREKVRRKWSQLFQSDSAPAHTALSIQEFLAEIEVSVVPHPSYSLYLAHCDFILFHRIKMMLKGEDLMTLTP
jgi:hypothetical protein